jgi:hypothetical protein
MSAVRFLLCAIFLLAEAVIRLILKADGGARRTLQSGSGMVVLGPKFRMVRWQVQIDRSGPLAVLALPSCATVSRLKAILTSLSSLVRVVCHVRFLRASSRNIL